MRFGKSDLGAESVRVRRWEHRRKLLGLLTVAYVPMPSWFTCSPAMLSGYVVSGHWAATTPG